MAGAVWEATVGAVASVCTIVGTTGSSDGVELPGATGRAVAAAEGGTGLIGTAGDA